MAVIQDSVEVEDGLDSPVYPIKISPPLSIDAGESKIHVPCLFLCDRPVSSTGMGSGRSEIEAGGCPISLTRSEECGQSTRTSSLPVLLCVGMKVLEFSFPEF
jgi:hypothetical protein